MKKLILKTFVLCMVLLLTTSSIALATTITDDKYAEAAELFQVFLEAIETIRVEPDRFSTLLMGYRPHLGVQFQNFERFTGGTDEEWFAKTPVDRWILSATYLQQLYRIGQGEREHHSWFGSEEIFLNRNIEWNLRRLSIDGDGSEHDAFKELMLWQYRYILTTGTTHNFITGISHPHSGEHMPITPQAPNVSYTPDDDYDLGLTDEERAELEEALAEAEMPPVSQQSEAERGFSWIPVIIVIVLVGAIIFGVIIFKKRK